MAALRLPPQVHYISASAANHVGEKLSKQSRAEPIAMRFAAHQLVDALRFLGQLTSEELKNTTPAEVWRWAIANWEVSCVPKNRSAPLPAPT